MVALSWQFLSFFFPLTVKENVLSAHLEENFGLILMFFNPLQEETDEIFDFLSFSGTRILQKMFTKFILVNQKLETDRR